MTKKVRIRRGLTTGLDQCKVGAILNNILSDDFLISSENDPLDILQKGLEENKEEIDLPHLCLESKHNKGAGVVSVRVFDYLRDGNCIIDIKYSDKIDGFLRGCYNLAEALKRYFEESEKQLNEIISKQ